MENLAKGTVYESMLGLLEVEDVQQQIKKKKPHLSAIESIDLALQGSISFAFFFFDGGQRY